MARLRFIVAREARKERGTYDYLEYALAAYGGDVIVDRRKEDRRHIDLRTKPDRRRDERRRCDAMTDLQTSGWALVRPRQPLEGGTGPMAVQCWRCHQEISPGDTVEAGRYSVVHVDCRRPRSLSSEEHVLLYVYCWDHRVALCEACSRSFRQRELGSDPFGSPTYGCLQCGADLTESIRAHLAACALLPEPLRRRVKEAHETTQGLLMS